MQIQVKITEVEICYEGYYTDNKNRRYSNLKYIFSVFSVYQVEREIHQAVRNGGKM